MTTQLRPTCMPLAQEFCTGRGIEIGAAAYSDFGVDAWNLDLVPVPPPDYQAEQLRIAGRVAPVHIVGLAETLPLREAAQDFVLASHVIEHSPNPIGTLIEWDSIIRPGGVLFLVVPHRDRTPDWWRLRTSLDHLIDDYRSARTSNTHAETEGFETPFKTHTPHYHTWTTVDFLAMVHWMITQGLVDWYLEALEDVDSDRGQGFTFVLRTRPGDLPRERAGAWVSRRALRALIRNAELLAFAVEHDLIERQALVEVVSGMVVGLDIHTQELSRLATAREHQIQALSAEQRRLQAELSGLQSWAADLERQLLALQAKLVHIPALGRLRGRVERLLR